MYKNSLIKLNSNEILIVDNVYYFKIFDINKYKTNIIYKNYISSDYLLNMNDGTIIQSCYQGIKRYLLKTMEELPEIIEFNNDEEDDYYDSEYYSDKINYIYKLEDQRIVLCHQNGKIEINKLNFI